MRPRLRLDVLAAEAIRNLTRVFIEPSPGLNVFAGANGQGKTSILEAIYLSCTSRSFRTSRLSEVVSHGHKAAFSRAQFTEVVPDQNGLTREQTTSIERGHVDVRVDGDKPPSLGAFATLSPVVVFHPDELNLSRGPAAARRTLLDRVALFIDASSASDRSRYTRALKQRREVLLREGTKGPTLDAFERLCAHHGARLTRARAQAALALGDALQEAFARIAAPELSLTSQFEPGGSDDEATALSALFEARSADCRRKTAGFGPHRDDLGLFLDGHAARVVGSQGQHRALTLALKAAEAVCVAEARDLSPIWLLDDVSSELDPERTKALFAFLSLLEGQVFLTTTRPDILAEGGVPRVLFRVHEGRVEAAQK